jgi:hypothetical protein
MAAACRDQHHPLGLLGEDLEELLLRLGGQLHHRRDHHEVREQGPAEPEGPEQDVQPLQDRLAPVHLHLLH